MFRPRCQLATVFLGTLLCDCTHLHAGGAIRWVCTDEMLHTQDPAKANQRALADASLAGVLRERGLASFVDTWYRQGLWGPLRRSPAFPAVMERRVQSTVTADQWADLLTYASTGHMVRHAQCHMRMHACYLDLASARVNSWP